MKKENFNNLVGTYSSLIYDSAFSAGMHHTHPDGIERGEYVLSGFSPIKPWSITKHPILQDTVNPHGQLNNIVYCANAAHGEH